MKGLEAKTLGLKKVIRHEYKRIVAFMLTVAMVVTNLKPAKLAGLLSEGMILCAEDADGKLSLMTTEKEMPAGAEIC